MHGARALDDVCRVRGHGERARVTPPTTLAGALLRCQLLAARLYGTRSGVRLTVTSLGARAFVRIHTVDADVHVVDGDSPELALGGLLADMVRVAELRERWRGTMTAATEARS